MQHYAKPIITLGILFIIIGLILNFGGDKLKWIGKLPGDIRIEKENFRFYFPITTLIIFSIILNIALKLYQKFFK